MTISFLIVSTILEVSSTQKKAGKTGRNYKVSFPILKEIGFPCQLLHVYTTVLNSCSFSRNCSGINPVGFTQNAQNPTLIRTLQSLVI